MVTERTFQSLRGGFVVQAAWVLAVLTFWQTPTAMGFPVFEVIIGPQGFARRWEAGMEVGLYSQVNLRTGRVVTALPIVSYDGRGPSTAFVLFHNMTSEWSEPSTPYNPIDPQFAYGPPIGDASGDGQVDEADINPFIDIMLDPAPSAQQIAVSDLDANAAVNEEDFGGLIETLSLMSGGPKWTHSYSSHLIIRTNSSGSIIIDVTLTWSDGTKDVFTRSGSDYLSPPGVFDVLTADDSGAGYMLTTKSQWKIHFTQDPQVTKGRRLDFIEDSAGNQLTCTYINNATDPADGKLDKVRDASGRELDLSYNAQGELKELRDPIGRTWKLLYEAVDPPGPPIQEGLGAFVALDDPMNYRIRIGYTDEWDIAAIMDKNGEFHQFWYDGGRLTSVADPVHLTGAEQHFGYYKQANDERLTAYTDLRGSDWLVHFAAEPLGNLLWVEDPLGNRQTLTYGETDPMLAHEPTTYTNSLSRTWTADYDARGNMLSVSQPAVGGATSTWSATYDALNNLTSVSDPDTPPNVVAYEYASPIDPTLVTKVTLPPDGEGNPAGDIALTYYGSADPNAKGQLKTISDIGGVETTTSFDEYGQFQRMIEGGFAPPGSPTRSKPSYVAKRNAVGMQTLSFNGVVPDGAIWRDDPPGGGARNCYRGTCQVNDDNGNPTDQTCEYCVFTCNSANPPNPIVCTWGTGSCSNPPLFPDAEEEPNPRSVECSPQVVGGKLHGSSIFTYDPMGRLLTAHTDGSDSSVFPQEFDVDTIFSYDALGRVISQELTTNEPRAGVHGGDSLFRYFYYDNNDLDGIYGRYGADGQLTRVFTDVANRTTSVTRGGLTATATYYANAQVKDITYGNNTRVKYQYDAAERLTQIRHERTDASGILQLGYTYDARNLITGISETRYYDASRSVIGGVTFQYDKRGRLIRETRDETVAAGVEPASYDISYAYDQNGNRTIKTDHFTGVVTRYHYDVDAEVDCDNDPGTDPISGAACYGSRNNRLYYYEVFDAAELLLERVDYEYGGTGVAEGNPTFIVSKKTSENVYHGIALKYNEAGEVWFVTKQTWDESDPECWEPVVERIDEFRASGRARRMSRQRRTDSHNLFVPGTTRWFDYDGDEIYADVAVEVPNFGEPMVIEELVSHLGGIGQFDLQTTAVNYQHGDQIGSLRAATDQPGSGSAQLLGHVVYTAFGEPVTSSLTSQGSSRYQYAGAWQYQSDENLPFMHVGHRWYDPSTGRFLQRDPIGIDGGLNVYAYADNSPVVGIDPFGLDIYIIVWDPIPGKSLGHSAIFVDSTMIYISFIPRDFLFDGRARPNRTPGKDFERYKNNRVRMWRLRGLNDEKKVSEAGLRYLKTNWRGIGNNCANCVMGSLCAGGGPRPPATIVSDGDTLKRYLTGTDAEGVLP